MDFTAALSATGHIPPVALLRLGLGDDGRLLSALPELGYRGAVLVSRAGAGAGEMLTQTYRFPSSEIELLDLGVIRAGTPDGLKAQLLLTLCLAAAITPEGVAAAFARVMATRPVTVRR